MFHSISLQALPLSLTILRIFLSPLIIIFLITNKGEKILIINTIIVIAGVTDFLDGFFARKLNAQTQIGSILDPVADKLFLNSCLIGLYVIGAISGVILFIFLLKDACLVLWFAVKNNKTNTNIQPICISKIATGMQFLACVLLINNIRFKNEILYLSMILSVISFVLYVSREYNKLIK